MTRRLEVVPDDDGDAGAPRRLRAPGVPASLTWMSALAILLLVALLVVAAVALVAHEL